MLGRTPTVYVKPVSMATNKFEPCEVLFSSAIGAVAQRVFPYNNAAFHLYSPLKSSRHDSVN